MNPGEERFRPALSVDCAVFGYEKEREDVQVLLVEQRDERIQGRWALPAGFVGIEESAEEAAARALAETTGIQRVYLEQLYTFSAPKRDPRGRVVSVAYYALVPYGDYQHLDGDEGASGVQWHSLESLPELVLDHREILETAMKRLRAKISYAPVGFELLPETFTIADLQRFHETILSRKIERRKFRRRFKELEILEETGEKERDVARRPGSLYRLNQERFQFLLKEGYPFEF